MSAAPSELPGTPDRIAGPSQELVCGCGNLRIEMPANAFVIEFSMRCNQCGETLTVMPSEPPVNQDKETEQ